MKLIKNITLLTVLTLSLMGYAETIPQTNKSGISVKLTGEEGKDFIVEYHYHDKDILDRKTIYIKAETEFSFIHNELNVARVKTKEYEPIGAFGLDNLPDTGDEGVIRYKIDGQLHWGPIWTSKNGTVSNVNPQYTTPLTFAKLTYPDSTSVLGSVGDNGKELTDKNSYYDYGTPDEGGNEWHTIQVADDDWNITTTDSEWRASDGKIYQFVVDPKTPIIIINSNAKSEFYTTPAKVYQIPKTFEQTTYIDDRLGDTIVTLRSLNSNKIYFRVTKDPSDSHIAYELAENGKTINSKTLSNGTSYIQAYNQNNPDNIISRKIVRNPKHPSANENNGLLLFGTEQNYQRVKHNYIDTNSYWWERYKNAKSASPETWIKLYKSRTRHTYSLALTYSLLAKEVGIDKRPWSTTDTWANMAKQMLLDNFRLIDPLGWEESHAQTTLPSRDIIYRGYYDNDPMFEMAYAYDLLISFYTDDKYKGGITPIEDFYIRDCIADFVWEGLKFNGGFSGSGNGQDSGGMWDTARKCAAVVGALAIPSYESDYYGVAGIKSNKVNDKPWTPFRDSPLTWEQALITQDYELQFYPNSNKWLGIEEYNCRVDGVFIDKPDYFGHMSSDMVLAANAIMFVYPEIRFPNLEACLKNAALGTLPGTKGPYKETQWSVPMAYNPRFPEAAAVGVPWIESLPWDNSASFSQASKGKVILSWALYQPEFILNSGSKPTEPSDLKTD